MLIGTKKEASAAEDSNLAGPAIKEGKSGKISKKLSLKVVIWSVVAFIFHCVLFELKNLS